MGRWGEVRVTGEVPGEGDVDDVRLIRVVFLMVYIISLREQPVDV